MLPTKFQVNWPFVSGEKVKIDFQDGCHCDHLGLWIGTILTIFALQDTPMLPFVCVEVFGLSTQWGYVECSQFT